MWTKMAGWPAGCKLALQAGLSKVAAASSGSAAFDFLSSEVLDQLPGEFQRFLIECSILPDLNAEVCEAITDAPDTQKWLREIKRRGLFVSELGGDLKFHDLFRDFLHARLRSTYTEEQISGLLVRAAAVERNPELRVSYLVRAKDYPAAERELSVIARVLLAEGELERLTDLTHLFPESYAEQSAEIAFISGLCESCYPRWEDTRIHMSNAVRLFREAGQIERCNRARAYELVAYFGLARTGEAMALLTELEQETLDIGTQALCAFAGYLLSRVGGSADQEMRYFDRMLDALLRCGDASVWNQCGLHIYLGLQRGMRGRAERYATGALSIAGEKYEALRDSAMSMRAWHNLLTGDYTKATAIIGEIEANQKWNSKPYSVRGSILIAKSLTIFLTGTQEDLRTAAAGFYSIFDGREGISWAYWRGLTALFFGKLHAAMADWDALDLACRRLDEELRVLDVPYLRLGRTYLSILQALHRNEAGISREAIAAIDVRPIIGDYLALEPALTATRAIVHARQREYTAAWQNLSQLVANLAATGETFHLILLGVPALRELANIPFAGGRFDEQRQILLALVNSIETARKTYNDRDQRPFLDLSAREREVLVRLANGDSNKMIARKLALSPHTVKRHVANILDKLGVQSRGQAAAVYRSKLAR
jgi:LuxR family maltose regulon positive regulatory protein